MFWRRRRTNLAAAYYDHYERYLRAPVDLVVYEDPALGRKIQILVYSKVFENCVTFATVGLSHFSGQTGGAGELVCVVDAVEEEVPRLLFNTVKTIVLKEIRLGWGIGLEGNERVSAPFVDATSKSCVYLTDPLPFPEGFRSLPADRGGAGPPRVYLMLFISQAEFELFRDRGAVEFERYMEREGIDPFDVMRQTSKRPGSP